MPNTTILTGDNTADLNLVSALVTMGFSAETGATTKDGKITRIFVISKTDCHNRYKVRDLMTAWYRGVEWQIENPEHPFGYLMTCLKVRKELLDGIKNDRPLEHIAIGEDSHAFLHPEILPENEAKLMGGVTE